MYPQYLPEYAQQLLDHMSRGLSFESFAAVLDLSTHRLISWCACHVDFREAREIGRAKSLYYWETQMRDYQDNPEGKPKFNFAYWKYNVSSQFPHLYGTKTAAYYQQLENEIYGVGYGEMTEDLQQEFSNPTEEIITDAELETPVVSEIIENQGYRPPLDITEVAELKASSGADSHSPAQTCIPPITDWDAEQAFLFDLVQRDGENTPKTEEEFVAMMTQFNQSEVHEPPTAPMITKAVIPPRISNRHKRHRSKYHR